MASSRSKTFSLSLRQRALHFLLSLRERAGVRRLECDVTNLGIARDDPSIIKKAIEQGLEFDALFVSGGMSMGQYDFVPRILKELGVELKITKLRIKPGKPFAFGMKDSRFKLE